MPATSPPLGDNRVPRVPSSRSSYRASTRWRAAALVTALALIGALFAFVLTPRQQLGGTHIGDPTLVADTQAIVGKGQGIPALSVARIEGGKTTFAGLGEANGTPPTPETPFELGSITKTFTGHLLAVAIERGEMRLEDPLASHLPELEGTSAGAATLRQLATHTSGLPRLPNEGISPFAGLSGENPYRGWSTARVIDAASRAEISDVGTRAYSNLGMALLGHAEAQAAGVGSWPELATDRLLRPLSMNQTRFVSESDAEPAGLATPHWTNGRVVDPWRGEGYSPAGSSTRTTARDLATYASAVLDGTAPGMTALAPQTEADNRSSGLAWVIDATDAGPLTWHNGGTGGSHSMLALDVPGKSAALALASSNASVDEVGIGLVRHEATPLSSSPDGMQIIALAVGLFGLVSVFTALARRRHRLALLAGVLDAVAGMVLATALGPWGLLPRWGLGALIGAALGGVVLAISAARTVPTVPATGKWLSIISVLISAALVVLVFLLVF